jgi:hypothetical protein
MQMGVNQQRKIKSLFRLFRVPAFVFSAFFLKNQKNEHRWKVAGAVYPGRYTCKLPSSVAIIISTIDDCCHRVVMAAAVAAAELSCPQLLKTRHPHTLPAHLQSSIAWQPVPFAV